MVTLVLFITVQHDLGIIKHAIKWFRLGC